MDLKKRLLERAFMGAKGGKRCKEAVGKKKKACTYRLNLRITYDRCCMAVRYAMCGAWINLQEVIKVENSFQIRWIKRVAYNQRCIGELEGSSKGGEIS